MMANDPEDNEEARKAISTASLSADRDAANDTGSANETETYHRESDGTEGESESGEEDEDEEDEDDEEPKLKYARMTGHLTQVYRNGDATSCFLVAGDKMVRLEAQDRSDNC